MARPARVSRHGYGRTWGVSLILAAVLAGAPAPLQAAPAHVEPAVDASTVTEMLHRLMLRIYILIGGDPAELQGKTLEQAAQAVNSRYAQHGIPELTIEQRTELLLALEELLLGTKLPPQGMSLQTWIQLTHTAASMWLDLTA